MSTARDSSTSNSKSSDASDESSFSWKNEEMVGFKDAESEIVGGLTGDSANLEVVSIFGMPGLGKTTLARHVFNHKEIARRFRSFRIFCCVSLVYNKKELFLDMLRQLKIYLDDHENKSDGELANILRQNLLGKRYLIVLDDVWEKEAWDDLRRSFPIQDQHSRILLTTRREDVAACAQENGRPYSLRFLEDEECWELLQKRIFKNSSCPEGLSDVGRKIAKCCHGLPLLVVLIAGVLEREDIDVSSWTRASNNFAPSSDENVSEACWSTINLSFQQLPESLKLCFLYFASVPEDTEIRTQELMRLWIAEGFIPLNEEKTAEDVAVDYLKNLTGRGLVITAKVSSRGGVKTVLVHDLILQFCLNKAEKENFLRRVDGVDLTHYSSPDPCPPPIQSYSDEVETKEEKNSSLICSLFCYEGEEHFLREPEAQKRFGHLRVLDLGVCIEDDFMDVICSLGELKYLAVKGLQSIPPLIANLKGLQTFIVRRHIYAVSWVSDKIWELENLKHILIAKCTTFEYGESFSRSSSFRNLESFSTPLLSFDHADIIRKTPNLRKLKCFFDGEKWYLCKQTLKIHYKLPGLGHLNSLESLNVENKKRIPLFPYEHFSLPSSLKKLTLTNFQFPWSHMSEIEKSLPNLEVLKLLSRALEGDKWEMTDEKFKNLRYLKLKGLNLHEWIASDESFPKLRRLALVSCRYLKEIPDRFQDVFTLHTTEVQDCSDTLEKSISDLKQCFEDNGYGELKVIASN